MWWRHIVAGLLKTQIVSSVKPVRSDRMAARWRHRMETFSALLAICAGNSPVTGEFPAQRPELWCFLWSAPENGWVNNPEAGDLRNNHAHYDVTVMGLGQWCLRRVCWRLATEWLQLWGCCISLETEQEGHGPFYDVFEIGIWGVNLYFCICVKSNWRGGSHKG